MLLRKKENASAIYIGVVEEDSSGYPDCSDNFIQKMQNAINEGTKRGYKNRDNNSSCSFK